MAKLRVGKLNMVLDNLVLNFFEKSKTLFTFVSRRNIALSLRYIFITLKTTNQSKVRFLTINFAFHRSECRDMKWRSLSSVPLAFRAVKFRWFQAQKFYNIFFEEFEETLFFRWVLIYLIPRYVKMWYFPLSILPFLCWNRQIKPKN